MKSADMNALMIHVASDLNNRLAELNTTVAPVLASQIADEMKRNTATGRAFGQDRYDDTYQGFNQGKRYPHSGYARKRQRAGVNVTPVTMRFKTNRIEGTQIATTAKGAEISFTDKKMGVIFGYHQAGINYKRVGFRQRSIFPRSAESIPHIIEVARRLVAEVLLK
jgi:hypothetical protein